MEENNKPKEKKIIRNIDGEEIDFYKDDLKEKLTFETAGFARRLFAYLLDFILIIAIWFIFSMFVFDFFKEVDEFITNFPATDEALQDPENFRIFSELMWKLVLNLILTYLAVQLVYFTLVPALLGDGRTLGKMLAGIGVIDIRTVNEVSPSRLFLREFLCRTLLETLLILPGIVSFIIALVRDDSRSLHDLLSKTAVIKLDLYNLE